MRVLGPYVFNTGRMAGRKYIQIYYDDGRKSTMLYSKWLMQESLGWTLTSSDHVHHENEDPQDDRLDNFGILSIEEHARQHRLGKPSPTKGIERGWRHGTIYGFMEKKCKCDKCKNARDVWNKERRENRQKTPYSGNDKRGPYGPRGLREHGTYQRYRQGCKCSDCRAANAAKARERRAKKGQG